jgi:DsbC/DsbD-like thiol-disulfide interchange protein
MGQELPRPPKVPVNPPRPPSGPTMPQPGGGGKPGAPGSAKTAEQLVQMTASAETDRIQPGGTFLLAFTFTIEPGWHIYWKYAGSSGSPTEIAVTGPSGFQIGKTLFPRPQAIQTDEGPSYGYEGKVVLFVEVTPPMESVPTHAMFNAKATWLVCKQICLMGHAAQMISVQADPSHRPSEPAPSSDPNITKFKKRLPQALTAAAGAEAKCDGKNLTIKLSSQGHKSAQFFPLETPGVEYGKPDVKPDGDSLIVTIPVTVKLNNTMGKPPVAAGVLGLGEGPDDPCFEVEASLSTS